MHQTASYSDNVLTPNAEMSGNLSKCNNTANFIVLGANMPYHPDVIEQHGQVLTPRLMLQLVDCAHADELAPLLPAASEQMLGSWPYPLTPSAASERIERAIAQTNRRDALAYVFSDRSTGRIAGWCSAVRWHEASDDIAMLTYWIGREFEGKGLVAEAVRAAGPHVLAWIGTSRLGAGAYPHNERSRKTMQRAGLTTPDGVRQLWSSTRGRDEPIICFVASHAQVSAWPDISCSASYTVGSEPADSTTGARAA